MQGLLQRLQQTLSFGSEKEGHGTRRIVSFTIGFAAACGLLIYVDSWGCRLLGFSAVLLLCLVRRNRESLWKRALLMVLGGLTGFFWVNGYSERYLEPISPMDGQTLHCILRAEDYSRETTYGISVSARMECAGKNYPVTVYLDPADAVEPGEQLEGDFRFRLTTEDGENPSSYYPGKGIFLLAYQEGDVVRTPGEPSFRDIPAKLRRQIGEILDRYIPESGFARALLLGDTSGLSYCVDTDLKVSGIRHVAAVSGLHISIFFTIISAITFKKRFLTVFAGLPMLALFAAVAGFTPSVNRACVMCALMLLAQLFRREYDGSTALSTAVLAMLLWNPYTITSVSFQLSVASVCGLLLFTPGIGNFFKKRIPQKRKYTFLLHKIASGVAVTLGAQVFTVPLCAYYFGMVSLVGILTNLLTLWAISLIFCLLVATCLLSLFTPALAKLTGTVAGFFIRYVLAVAHSIAAFPLAAVYTESIYIVVWLVFSYLLLGLFFLTGKRKPGAFLCCCALGLCVALTVSWLEPVSSDVSFTVLDVGQGQCLLYQAQSRTYVVDCGGDSDDRTADLAAQTLLTRGFTHVDGLILTHLDRDHAGGAENFLSRIQTDLLIVPEYPAEITVPEETQIVCAQQDLRISDGFSEISIFAPVFHGSGNEMSLCVLFDTEKCDILITGDRNGFGERSLLRHAQIPDVDILVAGHHGARDSTCEELLQTANPEIVCISAGEGNPYGHPAPETLQGLQNYGCTVYRTDQNGTITIRR